MWLRLRQIALMVEQLDAVVAELRQVLGIEVAFRDPSVAEWGLVNALLPVGDQFFEILQPVREGTAGGRQLARRGGDGGYMVILQSEDNRPLKGRLGALGVRVVTDRDLDDEYNLLQLHPKDTGGSFLEVDTQFGADVEPWGAWHPAGPNWKSAVNTDGVCGISAAEVQGPDPGALADRWGAILDTAVSEEGDVPTLHLDGATIRFVRDEDGRGEGLGGIDLASVDSDRIRAAARARGRLSGSGTVTIGGLRMNLVDASSAVHGCADRPDATA